jgi:hypothetical protein
MGLRDVIDEHAARELELTMENDSALYRQKQEIIKNLLKKAEKGKYDPKVAPKMWMHWVESGVRQYAKEHMGGNTAQALRAFSPATRRHVAEGLAREYEGRSPSDEGVGFSPKSHYGGFTGHKPAMPPGTHRG